MALGLIGGSIAAGLGEGGNKWIALQEKQRSEEAANQNRLQQIDYAATRAEEGKDKAQQRNAERMQEFKQAATQWRQENPKATMPDFVEHFATTEYADLLGPTIQAGQYRDSSTANEALAKLRELQGKQAEAQTEYIAGAKSDAERARAEAAKLRAETGGKGARGAGGTKGELTPKELADWRGDVMKRNSFEDPITQKPDTQANAMLMELADSLYSNDPAHNIAQAESVAVNAMHSGLEFADKQIAKMGGKADFDTRERLRRQGVQMYLQTLADSRKPKPAPGWGGEGKARPPYVEDTGEEDVPPAPAKQGLITSPRVSGFYSTRNQEVLKLQQGLVTNPRQSGFNSPENQEKLRKLRELGAL